ncbi:hypothetical protein TNCV_1589861 [Trichonephila clavipes]|uniref:Uncharacterized protein n=1 Tax=Trichonephila clavipes TaxID=2585209 RepID=A0A8X6RNY2_TRICX|nr:hypothetical protein TNCV_1589861 [Trichonephila clavipes]
MRYRNETLKPSVCSGFIFMDDNVRPQRALAETFLDTGSVERKPGKGHSRATTTREDHHLSMMARSNRNATASQLFRQHEAIIAHLVHEFWKVRTFARWMASQVSRSHLYGTCLGRCGEDNYNSQLPSENPPRSNYRIAERASGINCYTNP